MARIRSPNYPAISLPSALEKVRTIHKTEGRSATSKDVLAKTLGYSGLNGGSAMIVSALQKYGLLEPSADGETRISDLAMRILYHDTAEELGDALAEAALKPTLFADMHGKWPDRPPSDDSMKSFLVRRGFAEGALAQVIQVYRETIGVAFKGGQAQTSHVSGAGDATMASPTMEAATMPAAALPSASAAGRPFTVAFDGKVLTGSLRIETVREIDRFMKVLQAQKAALEAMEEEDLDDL